VTARRILLTIWIVLVAGSLYVYFFRPSLIQGGIDDAFSVSVAAGCALYLLLGCLRGFTLIPSAYLVLGAIAFLPPGPLLAMTLIGIAVSSSSIYFFSASMRFDEYVARRHPAGVARMRELLQRHELPIIVGWSFFPLAPTDLICYVCGVLRVNFPKFLFGVCLGEGAICAIYIYFGDWALRWLQIK
jgi:uncharacterized membrane protein YdjX (TVP38/TMEM64 family)